MAAPISDIDICNLALDILSEGGPQVLSINPPNTSVENTFSRWYDSTRQTLLREFVWNFAKSRTTLAASTTTTPLFDYGYAYLLPTDCLRLYSVGGINEMDPGWPYDIQGRFLYTNANSASAYTSDIIAQPWPTLTQTGTLTTTTGPIVNIRYASDVTNVALMDPLFVKVFAYQLASNVAYKFSTKTGIKDKVDETLARILPGALSVDGQERPPVRIQQSRYLDARYSGIGGSLYADAYTRFN